MKDRKELLDTLARSNETEASLVVIGIVLLDIRDLLEKIADGVMDMDLRDEGLRRLN